MKINLHSWGHSSWWEEAGTREASSGLQRSQLGISKVPTLEVGLDGPLSLPGAPRSESKAQVERRP